MYLVSEGGYHSIFDEYFEDEAEAFRRAEERNRLEWKLRRENPNRSLHATVQVYKVSDMKRRSTSLHDLKKLIEGVS